MCASFVQILFKRDVTASLDILPETIIFSVSLRLFWCHHTRGSDAVGVHQLKFASSSAALLFFVHNGIPTH